MDIKLGPILTNDKEKTFSQLVLEMHHEIGLIHKYVKNIDLTNKLILQQMRESENVQIQLEVEKPPQTTPPIPTVSAPTVSAPIELPPFPDHTLKTTKKVDVNQRLFFGSNGKNLSLAPIEIFDSTNNLVKKTRTNTSGRWSAQLLPGKYRVHVLKMGAKNNIIADMQYIININETTSTLEEVRI